MTTESTPMAATPGASNPPPSSRPLPAPRMLQGFVPAFTWGARLAFRPKRFLLIAIAAIAVGAFFGWATVSNQRISAGPDGKWFRFWEFMDKGGLTYVLPLIALLFVATGFSREISQRTLVYHLVRPISRSTLFLARYLSGLLPAIVVGTLLLWSIMQTTGLDFPASAYAQFALIATMDAVLLGAVFYLLASVFRWGTITGLIYVFAIESLLINARGAMQTLSMTYHIRSLFRDQLGPLFAEKSWRVERIVDPEYIPGPHGGMSDMAEQALSGFSKPVFESTSTAIITSLVFTAIFLAIGIWRTKRRDFPLKD